MRMINADDLEQALREAGLAEIIKDDCSKCTSAWGVPIVDAEPVRHGHWVEIEDSRVRGYCSVCGWESHLYEDDVVGMSYCPNCGAKMEEEDEQL